MARVSRRSYRRGKKTRKSGSCKKPKDLHPKTWEQLKFQAEQVAETIPAFPATVSVKVPSQRGGTLRRSIEFLSRISAVDVRSGFPLFS